jgi:trehalose-phosphatase
VGDDRTDEDAFRALRSRSSRAVTVRVTHGEEVATAAEFTVKDPAAVRKLLEWLLERSR